MIIQSNDRQDQEDQGGHMDNRHVNDYSMMPYDDPAIINPDELATFPKTATSGAYHQYHDHELHEITRRTPVRDGRNITRTDNHPDRNGFM
ncbi:hypothetical protein [uncultured Flavobacterium sp.]|uniref:hypothetical protein n=1 Tax=uncultured Flavobacterium sp. TaxID=165435 RepID=UPI0025F37843|nr:hypothetical protein [uncultured Flavobacterium sp.]